eukprot:TRINITY_DN46128_c0_g1_i1.p1 TRINITY_DN46128_c0_g1~~TRINITY_DN46128_c0_g1_i1.p1  ORF type:complete len:442 (+),score=129.47 TRINITY_DN46128_c0_g1_i1:94-1419(+)
MPKDIQNSGAFNTSGFGPYRPPEFFDDGAYKKGDIDKYHGQHRLVAQGGYKRLKKMQEGVLLVRFEMPFDTWCDGCGGLIAMGVRFGECEKTRVGSYFSTPLFRFRFRHFCGQWLAIENDPRQTTYNVTEGGRRKVNEWDPSGDPAVHRCRTAEERDRLRSDPAARAANSAADERTGRDAAVRIAELQVASDQRSDTQAVADLLRRRHQTLHSSHLRRTLQDRADRKRFGVALQPELAADVARASEVAFIGDSGSLARRVRQHRRSAAEHFEAAPPRAAAEAASAAGTPTAPAGAAAAACGAAVAEGVAPAAAPGSVLVVLRADGIGTDGRTPVLSVPASATARELRLLAARWLGRPAAERLHFAAEGRPGGGPALLAPAQHVADFAAACGVGREGVLELAATTEPPGPAAGGPRGGEPGPKRRRGAAPRPSSLGLLAAYD